MSGGGGGEVTHGLQEELEVGGVTAVLMLAYLLCAPLRPNKTNLYAIQKTQLKNSFYITNKTHNTKVDITRTGALP